MKDFGLSRWMGFRRRIRVDVSGQAFLRDLRQDEVVTTVSGLT